MQIRFCVASDLGFVVSHNGLHAARRKRGLQRVLRQASNLLAFVGLVFMCQTLVPLLSPCFMQIS